jgi:nucleotide-binding universal stress UspA family protein
MTYGIVAGYDGSADSGQAVRWAAREARARGTTLTVCFAWTPDHMVPPAESASFELARQRGKEILARGLPNAKSVLGPGRVHLVLAGGPAAQMLCERSRTAEMVPGTGCLPTATSPPHSCTQLRTSSTSVTRRSGPGFDAVAYG